MNEKQTVAQTVRPTKKQRELLTFIEAFIAEHGYSPSYREIMAGLNYTSVATVALHVNNLIQRGHIRKRDRSARSLEVVNAEGATKVTTNQIQPDEERWLVEKVEHAFSQAETAGDLSADQVAQLQILVSALRVLGLEGAALSFAPRLVLIKKRQMNETGV